MSAVSSVWLVVPFVWAALLVVGGGAPTRRVETSGKREEMFEAVIVWVEVVVVVVDILKVRVRRSKWVADAG